MATGVNSAGNAAMAAGRVPPGRIPPETPDCQTALHSLKHSLGKKKILPFQPPARGQLSMWPAFASGQSKPCHHKPCSAPEERQPGKKQPLLTIPKPQYLEELESYLRKELQSLDLTKKNSQELKLQPYREIFDCILDTFKTYKPLLSAIKKEYEVTLAHQKKTIHELESLKALAATVSEDCTQQVLALQAKEKDEINMLKQEKQRLVKTNDILKEENRSLQTQVEQLQSSVSEEYTRYLTERDARRLLLAQLNDLHQGQQDTRWPQSQEVKGEDVVKLKLALKVAQQDLTKAQVKLNTMVADYRDVVPRRDLESLENKCSALLQEDEEGNTQPFLTKLRNQYIREKQHYGRQLKDKLGDVREVKAEDLKDAFCMIKPDIDEQTLATHLGLAYPGPGEQPEQEALPLEAVLERLLTGDGRGVGASSRARSTQGLAGE